jgi:hypothetical protein
MNHGMRTAIGHVASGWAVAFGTITAVTLPSLQQARAESRVADTLPEAPEHRSTAKNVSLELVAGGAYLQGNVENLAGNGSLSLVAKLAERHQIFVDASGTYSKFGTKVVMDRQQGALMYALALQTHLNVFVYTTHARNRFLDLDYRTSNSLGLCWHNFAPTISRVILLSIGLTPEYQRWRDQTSEFAWRGTARLAFDVDVNAYTSTGLDATYTPVLHSLQAFRVFGTAYAQAKITPEVLSFRLAITDEYDSRPRRGVRKNDLSIVPSLVVKLGT